MELLKLNEALYDPDLFKDGAKECAICMDEFMSEQMVAMLPCDTRHYFHTGCIIAWSQNEKNCPLCKSEFDEDKIQRFHEEFYLLRAEAKATKMIQERGSCSEGACI